MGGKEYWGEREAHDVCSESQVSSWTFIPSHCGATDASHPERSTLKDHIGYSVKNTRVEGEEWRQCVLLEDVAIVK